MGEHKLTKFDKSRLLYWICSRERFRVDDWANPNLENELIHGAGMSVLCSVFQVDPGGSWFEIPYTGHSDYSGGTVHEANCEWLSSLGDIPGLVRVWGGHGTDGYYIHIRAIIRAMYDGFLFDKIESLDNYPLFDEDILQVVEDKILGSAFDDWARYDFAQGLEQAGYDVVSLPDESLRKLFYSALSEVEDCGLVYESHNSCYLDIGEILDVIEENKWLIDNE